MQQTDRESASNLADDALWIDEPTLSRTKQLNTPHPDDIKRLFYKWFFTLATIAACTALTVRSQFEYLALFDLILLPKLCLTFASAAVVTFFFPRHIKTTELIVFRIMEMYFLARIINGFFLLPSGSQRGIEFNDIMPWMGVYILFAFWVFERRRALIEVSVFVGLGVCLAIAFFTTTKELQPANYRLIFQQMLFANIAYAWIAYLFSWMIEAYTRENAKATMMRKMALTDPLTSVANRRQMELLLDAYDEQKETRPFGLLLIDLDHFKQVNDNYGHQIGDRVLQAASGAMKRSLRAYEAVGRWGGEEFLVLLPHLSLEDAETVAERLRRAIHLNPAEDGPSITASIGVIHASQADDRNQLLQRADEALYTAKRNGRDQVVVWSKTTPSI